MTVDEYIAAQPEEIQSVLISVRKTISASAALSAGAFFVAIADILEESRFDTFRRSEKAFRHISGRGRC